MWVNIRWNSRLSWADRELIAHFDLFRKFVSRTWVSDWPTINCNLISTLNFEFNTQRHKINKNTCDFSLAQAAASVSFEAHKFTENIFFSHFTFLSFFLRGEKIFLRHVMREGKENVWALSCTLQKISHATLLIHWEQFFKRAQHWLWVWLGFAL